MFLRIIFFCQQTFFQFTDRYYVGHSEDPDLKLSEHNFGDHHKSTSYGRPWVLKTIFEIQGGRFLVLKVK